MPASVMVFAAPSSAELQIVCNGFAEGTSYDVFNGVLWGYSRPSIDATWTARFRGRPMTATASCSSSAA